MQFSTQKEDLQQVRKIQISERKEQEEEEEEVLGGMMAQEKAEAEQKA